eukprot:scaffold258354_cov26-Tisochrysis_lutea.AAC.1
MASAVRSCCATVSRAYIRATSESQSPSVRGRGAAVPWRRRPPSRWRRRPPTADAKTVRAHLCRVEVGRQTRCQLLRVPTKVGRRDGDPCPRSPCSPPSGAAALPAGSRDRRRRRAAKAQAALPGCRRLLGHEQRVPPVAMLFERPNVKKKTAAPLVALLFDVSTSDL